MLFYLMYDEGDQNQNQEGDNQNQEGDNQNQNQEGDKTFTQKDVNTLVANERRKNEEKLKKVIGELEILKKSKGLTEKQQQDLSARIEELQDQLLTAEQLAQKDKEKLEKDYQTELTGITEDRDKWKKRFENALILNAIHQASKEHEAIDTSQIIALIQSHSPRVVQELDENGEPKDAFIPRVKLNTFDSKQSKEVTLDLTISEAVKRMKDEKKNFNLFKSTVNGGLGLEAGSGRSDTDTPPLNDPAAYRKWRQKHLKTS